MIFCVPNNSKLSERACALRWSGAQIDGPRSIIHLRYSACHACEQGKELAAALGVKHKGYKGSSRLAASFKW